MLGELVSGYASIVGLLSAFAASRNGQKTEDFQNFIEWLIEHNHEELVLEIHKNQSTAIFIKAFLNKEIPEIQLKLDSILALVFLFARPLFAHLFYLFADKALQHFQVAHHLK